MYEQLMEWPKSASSFPSPCQWDPRGQKLCKMQMPIADQEGWTSGIGNDKSHIRHKLQPFLLWLLLSARLFWVNGIRRFGSSRHSLLLGKDFLKRYVLQDFIIPSLCVDHIPHHRCPSMCLLLLLRILVNRGFDQQ